jgi:hypothetical protein
MMLTISEVIEGNRGILRIAGLPEDDMGSIAGMSLYYLKEYEANLIHIRNQLENLDRNIQKYQDAVKACEEAELKYKRLTDTFIYEKVMNKMVQDPGSGIQERDALTWNELTTMKGKPIWLERHGFSEWVLIMDVLKDIWYIDSTGYTRHVNRHNMGRNWRAYRNEK